MAERRRQAAVEFLFVGAYIEALIRGLHFRKYSMCSLEMHGGHVAHHAACNSSPKRMV